jgi:hypothetical protein
LVSSRLNADAKSNSCQKKDTCISGAHLEIDECVFNDLIEGLRFRSDGVTTQKDAAVGPR